jgi:hypothetical protein
MRGRGLLAGLLVGVQVLLGAAEAMAASSPHVVADESVFDRARFAWLRSDGANELVQGDFGVGLMDYISAVGGDAADPRVVASSGDTYFAWTRFDGSNWIVQARRRGADGSLTPIQNLSTAGQDARGARLALDSGGNVYYVWVRSNGTNYIAQARRRDADGTLGPVQNLSAGGGDADNPQLAIDPAGNVHFTWVRSNGTDTIVQTRRLSAAGTWSPMQGLSDPGQDATTPQLAVDPAGNVNFTWLRSNGANMVVQARRRSLAGTFAPVQRLSAPGQDASDPQVAVDPDGNAHFAWERFNGANHIVQTRRLAADGTTLGATQGVSVPGAHALGPRLAVDVEGSAYFTWYRSNGANTIVQMRVRKPDGTFFGVRALSAPGEDATEPEVAVSSDRYAVFVWQRAGLIQTRSRLPSGFPTDGTLGRTRTLSDR